MKKSAQWKEGINWLCWAQAMRNCVWIKDTNTTLCWKSEDRKKGLNALIWNSCIMCNKTLAVVGILPWFEYRGNFVWERSGQGYDCSYIGHHTCRQEMCISTPASLPLLKSGVSLLYKHKCFPRSRTWQYIVWGNVANRTVFKRFNLQVSHFLKALELFFCLFSFCAILQTVNLRTPILCLICDSLELWGSVVDGTGKAYRLFLLQ